VSVTRNVVLAPHLRHVLQGCVARRSCGTSRTIFHIPAPADKPAAADDSAAKRPSVIAAPGPNPGLLSTASTEQSLAASLSPPDAQDKSHSSSSTSEAEEPTLVSIHEEPGAAVSGARSEGGSL
jgi:hypothetical protein